MKSRTVTVHYCEFCGRRSFHKPRMERHEKRCGLNPKRECGCCELYLGELPTDMETLKALLPNERDFMEKIEENGFGISGDYINTEKLQQAVADALPALRKAANNCPACILAALRQADVCLWVANNQFDFKAEMEKVKSEYYADHKGYY